MKSPSLDLYATAAQVIPLFFGVLAFELRAFAVRAGESEEWSLQRSLELATPLLVIALLATGEVAAIHALTEVRQSEEASLAVGTSLFGGGLIVVMSVVGVVLRPVLPSSLDGAVESMRNVLVVLGVAAWLYSA